MDLDAMKYAELRKLAKSVGVKSNVKADKLLKALRLHFEQQESSENGNEVSSRDARVPEAAAGEPKAAADSLVTTRRGKNQRTKRKHSGDAVDPNPIPVQDDTQSPREEEQDGGSKRSSKRRKVSSHTQPKSPQVAEDDLLVQENNKGVIKKVAGKIPRHAGLMKKSAALRPTTPNFKKLHEAHFNRMESIDSYVQRRNKQMEGIRNAVQDLKVAPAHRVALFSPGAQERKTEKRRIKQTHKSSLKDSAPFRPSVFSSNKINVRFSQTAQDNEHKRSLIKTPARTSLAVPLTPASGRKSDLHANKHTTSVSKTPVIPFVFSGVTGTPSTTKKNTFDLKASLSRPLTYKPHKGKLKPFVVVQENTSVNKSQTIPSHQTNYKQHQVQTRAERRVKHTEDRKQKKEKMLCARRGMVTP